MTKRIKKAKAGKKHNKKAAAFSKANNGLRARKGRAKKAAATTNRRARSARQAPRVRTESRGVGEDLELMPVSRRSASNAAGQAGDLQGLPDTERASSESVDELLEEGNAREAEFVAGVENARLPEKGPLRTREVPEDDVPAEYIEQDPFERS